ncbi:MAG: hypothetical protein Q8N77_02155 [Nanoarchaeota archaeon]|nr:hypothetical protein [Nanoarchaeota archaeon]
MATIHPGSENGFSKGHDKKHHGTEVLAYIPSSVTSEENIEDFLFQYLGMTDLSYAQISLGKELINSLRGEYQTAAPVKVTISGQERPLTIGVSKRKLKTFSSDKRFKYRDWNLEKIIYTQEGFFIKYDSVPFESVTVHSKLMQELMRAGLDFWIDVPDNVTLTKGRNNIISNHGTAVLDGSYKAFESLFLDVILNDQELLYHPSKVLLESISNLFDRSYADMVGSSTKSQYSLGRRLASTGAAIGSKTADLGMLVASYVGRGIESCIKYPFTSMPGHIKTAAACIKDKIPEAGKGLLHLTSKWGPAIGLTLGAVYGGIKLYRAYGSTPFIYMAAGGSAIGAYYLVKSRKRIVEGLKGFFGGVDDFFDSGSDGVNYKSIFSKTGIFMQDTWMKLLNKCGLYVDMEEKRKQKEEEQKKRIASKYLSRMHVDEFFRKIMNKEIIPATCYYSKYGSQKDAKKSSPTFAESFKNLFLGDYDNVQYQEEEKWDLVIQKKNVQLSIDTLIELYLKKKLRYAKDSQLRGFFSDGEYSVDYNNPLVRTVVDKLEFLTQQIGAKYDVKILEDRLDNLWHFTKEACAAAYLLSPIGLAHLVASAMFKSVENPFKDRQFYNLMGDKISSVSKWCRENRDMLPQIGNAAKLAVTLPFIIPYAMAKGSYRHILVPSAKALNPVRYPQYISDLAGVIKEEFKERKLKKEKLKEYRQAEEKAGLLDRVKESCLNFYQSSIINELFGYGVVSGDSFHGLRKGKLEYMTKVTGAGKVYVNFVHAIEGIDRMISKALKESPYYSIKLDYSPAKKEEVDAGFRTKGQGALSIDLGSLTILSIIKDYAHSGRYGKLVKTLARDEALSQLGYTVLDSLIHQRAHKELNDYKHELYHHRDSIHPAGFFEKKAEIRKKVVSYLEKQNINLVDYLGKIFPEEDEKNRFYYILPERLSHLAHMTRRRLIDEAVVYEKLKEKDSEEV